MALGLKLAAFCVDEEKSRLQKGDRNPDLQRSILGPLQVHQASTFPGCILETIIRITGFQGNNGSRESKYRVQRSCQIQRVNTVHIVKHITTIEGIDSCCFQKPERRERKAQYCP